MVIDKKMSKWVAYKVNRLCAVRGTLGTNADHYYKTFQEEYQNMSSEERELADNEATNLSLH